MPALAERVFGCDVVVATGRALRADIVRDPPVVVAAGVALRTLRAARAVVVAGAVDAVFVGADVARVLVRRAGAAFDASNIKKVANNDNKTRVFIV